MRNIASIFVLSVALAAPVLGDMKSHDLFGDNAVLQQSVDVPVWGTARAGEVVTVEFQEQKIFTTAKDWKWLIRLRTLKPGGPLVMTISGDNILKYQNVLVGDVWLCAGQSDMEVGIGAVHNAKEELPKADHPSLTRI